MILCDSYDELNLSNGVNIDLTVYFKLLEYSRLKIILTSDNNVLGFDTIPNVFKFDVKSVNKIRSINKIDHLYLSTWNH